MDFFDALDGRYSHRGGYLPTPVPREALSRILAAGLAAPSGCNKQTTTLIAVDDPALLAQLGALLGNVGFAGAPAAICVLTQRIVAYGDRSFFVQDYAAAIENMLLAITALGYASCWVEGHVTGEDRIGRKMADLLGVPREVALVAYLPVGVPQAAGPRAARKPFAERAWFNGYRAPS